MSGLAKNISFGQGLVLAVSTIVGIGILGLPGLALSEGGTQVAAISWLFITAVVIPFIYIFSKLGIKFTSAAGLARYAEEALGKWASFAVSFILCGSFVLGIPAIALIGGMYILHLLPIPKESLPFLAILILAISTTLNSIGIRTTNKVNYISVFALIVLVIVLTVLNRSYLFHSFSVLHGIVRHTSVTYIQLWKVSALLFWAFIGWESLSFGLEEFKNPYKSIPRIYWLSFVIIALMYLVLAFTAIGAWSQGVKVASISGIASLTGQGVVSIVLVWVMVLIILANANAWVFSASRLVYAASEKRILPHFLAKLDKHASPINSLLTLFVAYTIVILAAFYTHFSFSNIVLLVSQNFIILYAVSIFAYWKVEKGWVRWPITLTASLSGLFLLSGFTWLVVYPAVLILIGYLVYRKSLR